MTTIDIHEAQATFARLIDAVATGEQFMIVVAGTPVALLGPIPAAKPVRRFGLLKGKISIADDFDAPLPPQTLADFEGS